MKNRIENFQTATPVNFIGMDGEIIQKTDIRTPLYGSLNFSAPPPASPHSGLKSAKRMAGTTFYDDRHILPKSRKREKLHNADAGSDLLQQIKDLQTKISGLNDKLAQAQNQLAAVNTQIANASNIPNVNGLRNNYLAPLRTQATGVQNQINSYNSQIAAIQNQINDLSEKYKIAAANDPATIRALADAQTQTLAAQATATQAANSSKTKWVVIAGGAALVLVVTLAVVLKK